LPFLSKLIIASISESFFCPPPPQPLLAWTPPRSRTFFFLPFAFFAYYSLRFADFKKASPSPSVFCGSFTSSFPFPLLPFRFALDAFWAEGPFSCRAFFFLCFCYPMRIVASLPLKFFFGSDSALVPQLTFPSQRPPLFPSPLPPGCFLLLRHPGWATFATAHTPRSGTTGGFFPIPLPRAPVLFTSLRMPRW